MPTERDTAAPPVPVDHDLPSDVGGLRVRDWAGRALLVAVPVLLVFFVYTRPVLRNGAERPPLLEWSSDWQLTPDFGFYVYQLTRACEVGGRWWKVGDDPLIGRPYQSEVSRSPALYEGIDLMLISAVTGRFIDPILNYHLMVFVVLTFNGWVAGALVFRMTRSYGWAALAQLLITINVDTLGRSLGHLHLFKFGWVLLAVSAFSQYLDSPSIRRGAWLGLATALVLQGSFYAGFFTMMALGIWWLGCLAAGQVTRKHLAATVVAGTALALVGGFFTFPVWTISRRTLFTDSFFERSRHDVWYHSADLWHIVCPTASALGQRFVNDLGQKGVRFGEPGTFLGFQALTAIAIYAVMRLRGRAVAITTGDSRWLDRMMGLMAVFVLLSLRGGPSFFLYEFVGSLRAYSRASALAKALGCVAGPAVLAGVLARTRIRAMPWGFRAVLAGGFVALGAFDAYYDYSRYVFGHHWLSTIDDPPAWSNWLARQPGAVRLAAFPPDDPGYDPLYAWGIPSVYPRTGHRHATLNGCDFRLLEADLSLLGASYRTMNPEGLRFIVSLGYETLAFHPRYLDANPWIRSLAWLDRGEAVGEWQIYRANARTPRFPAKPLVRLLAETPESRTPVRIPAGSWITGQWAVDRTTVVPRSPRVTMAWADSRGRTVRKPVPALYQHVFSPAFPAFIVRTPRKAGRYRLVFRDDQQREIASKPYVVVPELQTFREAFGSVGALPYTVNTTVVHTDGIVSDHVRIRIENASPYYLQSRSNRNEKLGAASSHPGMAGLGPDPGPGPGGPRITRGSGAIEITHWCGETLTGQRAIPLPHDLPPQERCELDIAIDGIGRSGQPDRVVISPVVAGAPPALAEAEDGALRAQVLIEVEDDPQQSQSAIAPVPLRR